MFDVSHPTFHSRIVVTVSHVYQRLLQILAPREVNGLSCIMKKTKYFLYYRVDLFRHHETLLLLFLFQFFLIHRIHNLLHHLNGRPQRQTNNVVVVAFYPLDQYRTNTLYAIATSLVRALSRLNICYDQVIRYC